MHFEIKIEPQLLIKFEKPLPDNYIMNNFFLAWCIYNDLNWLIIDQVISQLVVT